MNRRKISAILVVATLLTYMLKVEPVSDARLSVAASDQPSTPTAEPAEQSADEWLLANKQVDSSPIDPRLSVLRLESFAAADLHACARDSFAVLNAALSASQLPLAICVKLQV